MPPKPLEAHLYLFFDISNDQLSHAFFPISKRYHDIISDGILQQCYVNVQSGKLRELRIRLHPFTRNALTRRSLAP